MKINNEKIIIFALINLGLFSIISQVLLIRELLNSFFGNELFISLILAIWLFSTGLGSLWLAKFIKLKNLKILLFFHIFISIVLLNGFVLARLARVILTTYSADPSFILASFWCILVISPTAILAGILFVIISENIKLKLKDFQIISQSYIIESLGFFLGAILFNFILFKLSGLMAVLILVILNLLIALFFSFKFSFKISIILSAIILIIAASFIEIDFVDKKLSEKIYHGEELLTAINSKYGTIQITAGAGQTNFYYNGQYLDNSENNFHNELMVHLAALLLDEPKNALVIGNGFTGIIDELEKYKLKVTYLELDKELIKEADALGFKINGEIFNEDVRRFLNQGNNKFDLIIINYSNPATMAANRYFTKEFFQAIKKNLSEQGIVVLKLDTTPNYTFGAQNILINTLYQTLKRAIPQVLALPENEVMFLASQKELSYNFVNISKKYTELNLENKFLTKEYIDWRFTNDRVSWLNQRLSQLSGKINSDFKPNLYYEQMKIFLVKMQFNKGSLFIILGLILVFILVFFIKTKFKIKSFSLLFISALLEFSLISFEVLLILLFLTFHGYLYTQISLIIALILLGIAAGSFLTKKLLMFRKAGSILKISLLIILIVFVLPLIIVWQIKVLLGFKFVYYLLSLIAGFAIGTKFPVINKLYLKNSPNLGAVYGIDLIGGAIGALLAGTVMLPILGAIGSLELIVGLCLVSIVIIFFKKY
ncbi:MAG: hypothetical protein ABIG60_03015 [Patescibacteria group bacterium]